MNKKKTFSSALTIAILTNLIISPIGVQAEKNVEPKQEEAIKEKKQLNDNLIQPEESNDTNLHTNEDETTEDETTEDKTSKEQTTENGTSTEQTPKDQPTEEQTIKNKPTGEKEQPRKEKQDTPEAESIEEPDTSIQNMGEAAQIQMNHLNELSEGNSGPEIKAFKEKLMAAGFAPGWSNPNGNYGPQTVQYVKEFQAYYGLPVTGEGDDATVGQLDKVLNSPYQSGNSSAEIRELKTALMNLGFAPQWSNPNNNYGPETVDVVKNFQSYYGLVPNGIIDEVTYGIIQELSAAAAPAQNERAQGSEIKAFKEKLTAAGFTTWSNPNDVYGPETVEYVKDFQTYYGLAVTGEPDEATVNQLDKVLNSPYQAGKNSSNIQELKIALMNLGFAPQWNYPNGNYGPETVEVVKNFQTHYGLVPNGIIDEVTYAKIQELEEAPLSEGIKGADVKEFKEKLTAVGFTPWTSPNDVYGPETVEYVKNFQAYYGLEVTGEGDEATLQQLDRLLNSPYQEGNNSSEIRELKTALMNLGFAPQWTNPNGNYGPETVEVVKNFQTYYGLVPNGIIDSVTEAKIFDILNNTYQYGNTSSAIRKLKTALMNLGFAPQWTNPNGHYGPETVEVVKNFQSYYGLVPSGLVDDVTEEKIKSILNSPYQEGNSGPAIHAIKEDLMNLGFAPHWNSPNDNYGPGTVEVVKDFQTYYGLVPNGIIDSVTEAKIADILNSPYRLGQRSPQIQKVKEKLMYLGFAPHWTNPNNNYGPGTVEVVKNFQAYFGLPVSGIVDEVTLMEIERLSIQNNYTHYDITLNQALNMQMNATPQTDKPYAYVSTDWVNSNGIVTASTLNVRSGAGTRNSVVGQLSQGNKVNIISEVNGWYQISYNHRTWVNAAKEDVKHYLDPNNFTNSERQMFQFLNLARPSGANAAELNEYLEGKGILDGMGQAFIDAGRIHGVNEVYLLSHALLETGHGTSTLARGVQVNGRTVYNMFGIGAVDSNPIGGGSQYAYEAGWFTPEASIIGGARFIGNQYVKAGQNTLYKMRWNPDAMQSLGYAHHQYATDIGWASKQVNTMYNLYNDIGIRNKFLEIPVYKN